MSTQIYDLIDLIQSKSGLCIRKITIIQTELLERKTRFEPATLSLEGWCSTDWATSAIFWNRKTPFQNKSPIGKIVGLSVGEDGFEPPKVKTSRFTVCPIWPLWYSPKIHLELLSRWRESNPRPRDYKSRALANWATSALLFFPVRSLCFLKGLQR